MSIKRLSIACVPFLLAAGVTFGAWMLRDNSSVLASPGILYVAPGGLCGGATPCYDNVQSAVDAAQATDQIQIAAGNYTDTHIRPRSDTTNTGFVTQTVYISKTVTLRGGYNADFSTWNPATYSTTLDAHGQGRVLYITGNITPTIEGLRITGGNASGLGGYDYYGSYDAGGGVYIITATATLNNNWLFSNTAAYGAGLFQNHNSGALNNSTIANNTAANAGGGLFLYKSAVALNSNEILSNTSDNLGGGVYLFGANATLTGNRIAGNTANSLGGGVDVASCSPTFNDNIVSGNTANKGGGLYIWYSHSQFTNNVIADNQANAAGSGVWVGGSEPHLQHTTIARNTGSDGVRITDAGGTPSTLALTNTLLISHTVDISITADSAATLNGVLWYSTPVTISQISATVSVHNQYTGNPAFDLDGYHLTSGSAAINKGVPADIFTDIDNQPRSTQTPDLGADEYWSSGPLKYLYLPVVMRNS